MPYADQVDAEPVRIHVKELLAGGMTIPQIQYASGIDRTIIRVLVGEAPGRPPSRQVTRNTAECLLRVRLNRGLTAGGLVYSVGTRRRIQALGVLGWTQSQIGQRLGHRARALQIGRQSMAESSSALAIMEIYDELRHQPGPSEVTRVRSRAMGWLGPEWWDDETIDDPLFVPPTQVYRVVSSSANRYSSEDVDEVAVAEAMAGRIPPGLTVQERAEAMRRMYERGMADREIGERFGLSADAVLKVRSRPTPTSGVLLDDYALPRVDRVQLLKLHGYSPMEMAERIGVPLRYVHRDLLGVRSRRAS